MRRTHFFLALFLGAALFTPNSFAQQSASEIADSTSALPDAPSEAQSSATGQNAQDPSLKNVDQGMQGKQTKRILGIIPNFHAVSVDAELPPLSVRNKFTLMLQDSFDYSSFIYVGILSGISQAQDSYPEFGSGAPAYARYYWHSFADTVNGNLMTEFLYPVAFRQDPRYYTLGRDGFVKRSGYAISRLLRTKNDKGNWVPNISEIAGNGSAAGISSLYYPSSERTWTKVGQRWVTQVGLDGFANMVKEFWPDVNAKLFHNHY